MQKGGLSGLGGVSRCFCLQALDKRRGVNDPPTVKTTGYKFLFVMGFQLEGDGWAIGLNDAGHAGHGVGERRGGQVLEFDFGADAGFVWVQERFDEFDGGVLEKPDERGGA